MTNFLWSFPAFEITEVTAAHRGARFIVLFFAAHPCFCLKAEECKKHSSFAFVFHLLCYLCVSLPLLFHSAFFPLLVSQTPFG